MGQWMSREMPEGARVKHFRARRVMKRDVPGTARLMGRERAVLESALPLLGARVDFVQRCGSALRKEPCSYR